MGDALARCEVAAEGWRRCNVATQAAARRLAQAPLETA